MKLRDKDVLNLMFVEWDALVIVNYIVSLSIQFRKLLTLNMHNFNLICQLDGDNVGG